MKCAFFLFLALAASAQAVEVRASFDIKSRTQLGWAKIDKFRHSVDCYTFGRADETTDLPAETIDGQLYANDVGVNADGSPAVSSIPLDSKSQNIRLGTIDFTLAHKRVNAQSEKYSMTLIHQAPMNSFRNIGDSHCGIHEYHWNASNTALSGSYSLKITMPTDARILKIRLSGTGHAIRFDKLQIRGDYPAQIVTKDEDFYIWGKPGSTLEIPLTLSVSSTGGFDGELDILISKSGLDSSVDPLASLQQSITALDPKSTASVEAFLNAGASIAGHPDVATKVVSQMGIDPIQKLNSKLFGVANANLPASKFARDVKAMSAVVSYELAMALLDSLKGFCATKDIYLPLTDQTVRRQGFLVAYFWIAQSIAQVESLNYPEVEEYLNGLTRWENDNMTYAQIANDKQAFNRLVEAFKKLRTQSRFAWPVYTPLKATLQKVVSTFGTVGSDSSAVGEIYKQIDVLAAKQLDINQRIQKLSFSFIKTNNDPVLASPILKDLKDFEAQALGLSQTMSKSLKFYSLNPDGTSANVLEVMTDSLAHQIAIFEKPLNDKFIEAIRQTFVSSSRVADLKTSYNQCLEVK